MGEGRPSTNSSAAASEDGGESSRLAREGRRFLIKASSILAGSLDYQATLTNVAQLAVPELAEWCAVDVLEDGKLIRIAVAHEDPDKIRWAKEIQERIPVYMDAPTGVPNVLRTGNSEIYPVIDDGVLEAAGLEPEVLELVKQANIKSVLLVPLTSRGETIGALTFVSGIPGRYGTADLEMAEELARRAGVAVDNARLYCSLEKELEERKRAEAALGQSEERFRLALSSGSIVVYQQDADLRYTWVYPQRNVDRLAIGKTDEELVDAEDARILTRLKRKVLDTGVPARTERRTKVGDKIFHYDLSIEPMRDIEGKIVGVNGTAVDITDRVLAEEEVRALNASLEKRVEQRTIELQAAVSELEGFTYSVSHDLRGPLRAIMGCSMILLEDYGERLDPAGAEQLRRQASAANRLGTLIDDLLKLSLLARADLSKAWLDLTQIVRELLDEIGGEYPHTQVLVQPGMVAFGDPRLLTFALQNLLENAFKFSANEEQPLVEVGSVGSGEIFVRDNGIGFDMQFAHKLFLPFERLVSDSDYPGTGVGLANVKRIVDRHGGSLRVDSTPGEGATFYFSLPETVEQIAKSS